jgi:hypothetical protein
MATHSTARMNRRRFAVCVIALCILTWGETVFSQIEPEHVVRVTVTDRNGVGQSSTGFLWQNNQQVVTSLHAVLHKALSGRTIRVYCNGIPTEADVSGVFQRADLVLLTLVKPIQHCKVYKDDMLQGLTVASLKPAANTQLYTFGWKGAASSSTGRNLFKGKVGGAETLEGLIAYKETKEIIRSLRLPAMNLDIYFVTGDGLGGGYSGAPVVDSSSRLIGIVDGGLDKGTSDYNWIIPATNLIDLIKRKEEKETTLPKVDLTLLENHFSAGLVEPPEAQSEVLFRPQPRAAQIGSRYHFIKTKTRSLASLASTSDDPDGILQLVRYFGNALRPDVEQSLSFDIFEDLERSLIIAVPVGQGLIDGPVPEYPDTYLLRSEAATPGDEIQFEELVPDAQGYQRVATGSDGKVYFPEERGYFNAYIYQTVKDCQAGGDQCQYISDTTRMVRFDNGNKVLSFGIFVEPPPDTYPYFNYYSVAVRQNVAFEARAQIQIFPKEEGLFQCKSARVPCKDSSKVLTQLSQLVAAELTTFRKSGTSLGE